MGETPSRSCRRTPIGGPHLRASALVQVEPVIVHDLATALAIASSRLTSRSLAIRHELAGIRRILR
jgi:hypothetical protein